MDDVLALEPKRAHSRSTMSYERRHILARWRNAHHPACAAFAGKLLIGVLYGLSACALPDIQVHGRVDSGNQRQANEPTHAAAQNFHDTCQPLA